MCIGGFGDGDGEAILFVVIVMVVVEVEVEVEVKRTYCLELLRKRLLAIHRHRVGYPSTLYT